MDANRTIPLAGLLIETCTLCDCQGWLRWVWQIAGHFGCTWSYHEVYDHWYQQRFPEFDHGEETFRQAVEQWLHEAGLTPGQANELSFASLGQLRANRSELRLLPGAGDALRELASRGVAIGLLADNIDGEQSWQTRLAGWGLADAVVSIISSHDRHAADNMADSFREAVSAMGTPLYELGWVGQIESHGHLASALGLRTFFLGSDHAGSFDYRITQLQEVVALTPVRIPQPLAA